MKKDTKKTKVIFLINEHGDEGHDLYASFPELIEELGNANTCYSEIGQHSTVFCEYIEESREATKEEYSELLSELEQLGYNLQILNK